MLLLGRSRGRLGPGAPAADLFSYVSPNSIL